MEITNKSLCILFGLNIIILTPIMFGFEPISYIGVMGAIPLSIGLSE